MNILGLTCYTHDAAACLVCDGEVAAAALEERFTRKAGTGDFPLNAINHCIQTAGITFSDINAVAFFEKAYLRFYRELIGYLRAFPWSYGAFLREMPLWLQDRLILPLVLEREIGYTGPVHFIRHHLAHAASAFYTAGCGRAAVVVADGAGEWASVSYGHAGEQGITMLREQYYPDSLGLLYSAVTEHVGFKRGEEAQVEALSAEGVPRYVEAVRKMITVREDGSFRLAREVFGYRRRMQPGERAMSKVLGPPRAAGAPVEQRHRDLAASVQIVLEETLVTIAQQARRETGCEAVCLAGGVMRNGRAVQRIVEAGIFEEVYVPAAPGVGGAALGAALAAHVLVHVQGRPAGLRHAAHGARFTAAACRRALVNAGVGCEELDEAGLVVAVAEEIAAGGVVAWFEGPEAFSAEGQGWRALLGDARKAEVCERLRAGAGMCEVLVRAEAAGAWFERVHGTGVAVCMPRARGGARQEIAGALAADGRARVLVISTESHPLLWRLLGAVEERTGAPLVASAALRAEDGVIVCQPEEAVRVYTAGGADALALGTSFTARRRDMRE